MSSQYYLTLCTLLLSIIIFILFIQQKTKTKNLPPGPNKLPLIGNLHQIGNAPHRAFQVLANKYGPLMFLQLGSVPTLVISSAEIARDVFKNHDVAFAGRPNLYAVKRFSYNGASMGFAPHGEYWREIRKIAILELLSIKRVQSFSKVRDQEIASMIDSIATSPDNVDLTELAITMTNNVVRMVMFSDQGNEKEIGCRRSLSEIFGEMQALLGGFCLSDFFPWMEWWNKFNGLEAKVERCFKELDAYYDKVLEEHLDPKREIHEHVDLVDVLLMLQKDSNQSLKLKNDHVKGALTDLFAAGTDTSSAVLVWIMAELIKHPINMKKVQDELRAIGNKKQKIEESDLSKLPYLKMVIKEGLRLHPPLPLIPRETTQTCTIGGFEVLTKTRVFLNVKSIATDPKHWENPNEFEPERFSDNSIDFRGQHYEYLPFGVGRRSCPGINFALPLVELSLANLLYKFNWSLPQGMGVEDVDMEDKFGLVVLKKVPLCLVASLADN